MSHNRVYIALGTNVGNWKNNFSQAIHQISNLGIIMKSSSIYLSKPSGYKNQEYFYNSALELKTFLSPMRLFMALQLIEKKMRRNKKILQGPRNIDLDIIFFNQMRFNSRLLKIPHYAAHKRDFVLMPLKEMNPLLFHPIYKKTVSELYEILKEKFVFKVKRHKIKSLIIY